MGLSLALESAERVELAAKPLEEVSQQLELEHLEHRNALACLECDQPKVGGLVRKET